jgi:hypothetical protein
MEAERIGALVAVHDAHGWIIGRGLAAKYAGFRDYAAALILWIADMTVAIAGLNEYERTIARATFEARLVRKELVEDHMQPLAAVARLVMPAVVDKVEALQMPKQGIDAGQLLVKAEAMACAIELHLGGFVQQGLPSFGSIAGLREAADSLQQATDARAQAVARCKLAGDSIDAEFGRVRAGLLGTLSGWVVERYQDDPEALAEWTGIMARTRMDGEPIATAESDPASPESSTSVPEVEGTIASTTVAPATDALQQRAA